MKVEVHPQGRNVNRCCMAVVSSCCEVSLYKASQVAEREGRIDSAIRQIELAIGLLEMHSADKGVLGRYYSRLEGLQAFVKKK